MNTKFYLLVLAIVALFSSCSKVQVSQDYAQDYEFGKEKTFGWNEQLQKETGDILNENELLAGRVKASIEDVLTTRGYKQASQPDFLVSCVYSVTSRLRSNSVNTGFGVGYGRYGRHTGVGISTGNNIRQYDQGKLVINIHQAQTQNLIWKGTGTREVFTHASPEEITRGVRETVESILQQFPPVK